MKLTLSDFFFIPVTLEQLEVLSLNSTAINPCDIPPLMIPSFSTHFLDSMLFHPAFSMLSGSPIGDLYDWLTDNISHRGGGDFLMKFYDGDTHHLTKGWKLQIKVSHRVFKGPAS